MNLLVQQPSNFRYKLMVTTDNIVFLLFYRHNTDFNSDDEITFMEDTFIPNSLNQYKFDESKTETVTVACNYERLNEMNVKVVEFLNKYSGAKQVRFYTLNVHFKMLFEEKVFDAVCNCTKDFYMELGESGIRIGNADRPPLDKLYIQSGKLYPSTGSIVTLKEAFIVDAYIYGENDTDELRNLNFVVTEKFNAIRISHYSPIKVVISSGPQNSEQFSNSIVNISVYYFYGIEKKDEDKDNYRLSIYGIRNCTLTTIEVHDEFILGRLLYVDRVTSLTISGLNRNVKAIEKGAPITINRVGSTSLYKLNYKITKDSMITDGYRIVEIMKDTDSGLKKNLFVYESSLTNGNDIRYTLVHIGETTLNMLYISDCSVSGGVDIVSVDDNCVFDKYTYNSSVVDFDKTTEIKNATTLSILKSTIKCSGDIICDAPKIIIDGSTLETKKNVILQYTKEYITKVVTTSSMFICDKMYIQEINDQLSVCSMFDTGSTFEMDTLQITGFRPSLNQSLMRLKTLIITSGSICNFQDMRVPFTFNEFNLTVRASSNGTIRFVNDSDGNTFNLNISDINLALPVNSFNFLSGVMSPEFTVTSNVPIKGTFENWNKKILNVNISNEYDSEQPCKLTFVPNVVFPTVYEVLTNNAKSNTVTKTKNVHGYDVYTIKHTK